MGITLKPEDVEYLKISRNEKDPYDNSIYFRVPLEKAQHIFSKKKALNAYGGIDNSYTEGTLFFWFDPCKY